MNRKVNGQQTIIKGIKQRIIFNKSEQQTLISGIE